MDALPQNLLVVNLDRCPERFAYILSEIRRKWPYEATRMTAYDGLKINIARMRQAGILREHSELLRELMPGEIGAWLSHRRAWKQVKRLGRSAVIIEDDIKLTTGFSLNLNRRLLALEDTGYEWDLCFVGHLSGVADWAIKLDSAPLLPGGFAVLNESTAGCPGAFAYVLKRAGASRLLQLANQLLIDRPIDELLQYAFRTLSVRCIAAVPTLARHGRTATGHAFSSTIRAIPNPLQ